MFSFPFGLLGRSLFPAPSYTSTVEYLGGSNARIETGTSADLVTTLTGSWSVALVFKLDGLGTASGGRIFTAATNNDFAPGFNLRYAQSAVDGSNGFLVQLYNDSNTLVAEQGITISSTSGDTNPIEATPNVNFHMLVMTYDASTGVVSFFYDGTAASTNGTNNTGLDVLAETGMEITFGNNNGGGRQMDGNVALGALYSTVLDANQASDLWNGGALTDPRNVAGDFLKQAFIFNQDVNLETADGVTNLLASGLDATATNMTNAGNKESDTP